MTGKGSYKKQAERNLEKAVCNGQMSISDYYTRKMEIQQCSVGGVDDGHSCTRGKGVVLEGWTTDTHLLEVRV